MVNSDNLAYNKVIVLKTHSCAILGVFYNITSAAQTQRSLIEGGGGVKH